MMNTIRGAVAVSLRVAHVTRDTSCRTWLTNCAGLTFAIVIPVPTPERGRRPPVSRQRPRAHPIDWQEWRGSNPQPPVLETGALPVELHSCQRRSDERRVGKECVSTGRARVSPSHKQKKKINQ